MYVLLSIAALVLGFIFGSAAFGAVGGGFFGFVAAVVTFVVTGWVLYYGGALLAGSMSTERHQIAGGVADDEVDIAVAQLRRGTNTTQLENQRRASQMAAQQTPEARARMFRLMPWPRDPCTEDGRINGDYSPPEGCGEVTVTGTVTGTITVTREQEVRLRGEAESIVVDGGNVTIEHGATVRGDVVFESGSLLVHGTIRGTIRNDLFVETDFFRVPDGHVYAPNGPAYSPYVYITKDAVLGDHTVY